MKKTKFFGEFKKFITRGNVIDLAVGIIIGGAFTAIVNSVVNDLLMPIISLVKKGGFSEMYVGLIQEGVASADVTLANGALIKAGEPLFRTYLYYGNFIQAVLNFFLIALTLFIIVKIINTIREKSEQFKTRIEENKKNSESTAAESETVEKK